MGIIGQTADAIIRIHKSQPVEGRILICGRQTVFMTPAEAAARLRAHGVEPRIPIEECELDRETRIGGEGQEALGGKFISDRSFFRMLGAEGLEFLDHSAYEGATTIVDLNQPLPAEMEGQFDFIIDGGTLDNVFNPAQTIMNLSRMLRAGGRLLTYNYYANFGATYTNLPHQWYLDYFAINGFAYAQVYISVFDSFDSRSSVYQANLAKRAATRCIVLNFPGGEPATPSSTLVYAIKADNSTWSRQPSQECYRTEEEWRAIEPGFARFAAYDRSTPVLRSMLAGPIRLPGGDDFQHVDCDANIITEDSRESHDKALRQNILQSMRAMNILQKEKPWGVFETEKVFFDLMNELEEAQSIIAQPNVYLFDVRMLSEIVTVGGLGKRIYPGTTAFIADMPILVINREPELDIMWRRLSRLFPNNKFYAACLYREIHPPEGGLVDYAKSWVYLSPSLEAGDRVSVAGPVVFPPAVPSGDVDLAYTRSARLLHELLTRAKSRIGSLFDFRRESSGQTGD